MAREINKNLELTNFKVGDFVVDLCYGRRGVVEAVLSESDMVRVRQEPLDKNIHCTYTPKNGNIMKLDDRWYGFSAYDYLKYQGIVNPVKKGEIRLIVCTWGDKTNKTFDATLSDGYIGCPTIKCDKDCSNCLFSKPHRKDRWTSKEVLNHLIVEDRTDED